ncbi:MAG: rhomboid family intramembrane serine protease [Planctomycetia bacterium]|nr:rhomboid family intramembrane serine protease [Planctomycetia bacterium]
MGIYDRDYYQTQRPGISIRGPSSVVGWLIAINAAVFLADGLLTPNNNEIIESLAAKVGTLTAPWLWWQFLTYGFAHSPWPNYWHILGNMLGLWFLGRDIEYTYGPREFLRLYLTMIVLGGIAWAGTSTLQGLPPDLPLVGASGAVTGIVVLYALHFPRRTLLLFFVLPVPAWAVGVLVVVTNLRGAAVLGNDDHIAYGVHLAGIAFALAYYRFHWNLGRLVGGRFSLDWLKRRPKFRVHDPDPFDHRNRQDQGAEDTSAEEDRILEKIHRQGIESLTRQERRTLEAASRRYQSRRPG